MLISSFVGHLIYLICLEFVCLSISFLVTLYWFNKKFPSVEGGVKKYLQTFFAKSYSWYFLAKISLYYAIITGSVGNYGIDIIQLLLAVIILYLLNRALVKTGLVIKFKKSIRFFIVGYLSYSIAQTVILLILFIVFVAPRNSGW